VDVRLRRQRLQVYAEHLAEPFGRQGGGAHLLVTQEIQEVLKVLAEGRDGTCRNSHQARSLRYAHHPPLRGPGLYCPCRAK
jgi:hypothetical protein